VAGQWQCGCGVDSAALGGCSCLAHGRSGQAGTTAAVDPDTCCGGSLCSDHSTQSGRLGGAGGGRRLVSTDGPLAFCRGKTVGGGVDAECFGAPAERCGAGATARAGGVAGCSICGYSGG